MKRPGFAPLIAILLILLLPSGARAGGVITALTASANPVKINTDVTFTMQGTTGVCDDLLLDYGDGQSYKMLDVNFTKNLGLASPPHQYSVAKTYLVKASPGRNCTGTATLSLNVTGGGAGGPVGGVAGSMSRMARQAEANLLRAMAPHIDSVFPFSTIRPGGAVIVQGGNFGPSPGKFLLKLQNGQVTEMGGLTWAGNSVSGTIDPNISGVFDQPATLQVITADGNDSNEMPVTFTAAREVRMLPITDIQCYAEPKTDRDVCNDFGPEFNVSFNGFHQCRDVADYVTGCWDSGVDAYWSTLANGWKLHSAENYQGKSYSGPAKVVEEGPGPIKITVWWDTRQNMSVGYTGRIYIEGPAGTSWK